MSNDPETDRVKTSVVVVFLLVMVAGFVWASCPDRPPRPTRATFPAVTAEEVGRAVGSRAAGFGRGFVGGARERIGQGTGTGK